MSLRRSFGRLAATSLVLASSLACAAHPAHRDPPVQVAIVLFDGVQIIDFSAPYEVFGQAGFGVYTVSADGAPVTTAMGLRVTPDHAFADAPPADVLLVPGGDVRDAAKDNALLAFVRERSAVSRHVLSVCTGATILAAGGLLDGGRATTFHQALASLARNYPEVEVVRDVRWVDSGRIVTAAGLSSGIDAALHVVALLRGEDVARSTALHLEYAWDPKGGFVRGVLADRWLPGLDDAAWPPETTFERMVSLGDVDAWRIRYRVTSSGGADAVLASISAAMRNEAAWTPVASSPMRFTADLGGAVRELAFDATAAEGTGFVLEVTLSTRDAAKADGARRG
ncbi:DJ-1/PfpI family protein [Chiayiivirga flava]|uniref:Putative intracellular protease/amidase n=1 Tax=Chiayiivirga flava TaxID=659595 RepID=A0A7W8D5J2_9GAMM|nr:DJ-1/PfpI family protein [Chiayiivirga flava]MBB5207107.1 putative intracellular protease/amidase [Chiayiivirga flava]